MPSFTEAEIHSAQHVRDGILLVVSSFVLCYVHEILSELIIKRELFVDDLTDLMLAVCRDIVVTSVVSEEAIAANSTFGFCHLIFICQFFRARSKS